MPTIFRWRGHRFLFYSKEIGEPPHVHVLKNGKQLKIWLSSMEVTRNAGFAAHEVNAIVKFASTKQDEITKAWNDYFGN